MQNARVRGRDSSEDLGMTDPDLGMTEERRGRDSSENLGMTDPDLGMTEERRGRDSSSSDSLGMTKGSDIGMTGRKE